MHPIPSLLLLLLPLFPTVTTSFPLNCTQTFSCGPLHNLSYPFTGGPQPAYCGPPEFHLTCTDDNNTTPILTTTDSLSYRVIQLDQTQNTLTLSRLDLYNNTCTKNLTNTTLNPTIYTPSPNNVDLTIFYGCTSSINSSKPINQFSCEINGNVSAAYYLTGPVPTDPAMAVIRRDVRVKVPVLETAAERLLNSTVLAEVLMEGFNVSYMNPYGDDCAMCRDFGADCGFDEVFGGPICLCGDEYCPKAGSKKLKFVVGLAFSGSVAVTIILICALRRKLLLAKVMILWKEKTTNDQIEAFIRSYGTLTPKRYSYSDIKKMTKSFTNKLGQGGYGGVYKGKLPDGRPVAVKLLSELKGNGEEFINEVASISRTSHVNVVTLVGFCYEKTKRGLIYEFMPNGSLDKFIYDQESSHTSRNLQWETLYQIAVGIARGLDYLHRGCNTRIVHFDIKPHNILLDEDLCPKISDFGLAKLCTRKESIVSMLGARGTAGYIAPEVFCRNFGGVSHKSDVYSYGMMVLEMVGGRKNINVGVANTSEIYFPHWIYKQLEPGKDLGLHGDMTEQEEETARKMIIVSLWCIQINPSDRPSMTKVVEMLEGSLQSLQIPPMPTLSSPRKSPQHSSTTSSSSP